MIWRFNPAEVKAIDLKNAKAGDFLWALRSGTMYEHWLRLGGPPTSPSMMNLTGAHAFEVWNIQRQGSIPTMRIAEGPKLQLEIAEIKQPAGNAEKPGDLFIADGGAFICGTVKSDGFYGNCPISLATWEVAAPSEVGDVRISFSIWRLVDHSQPNDRKIVFAVGDWANVEA